MSDNFLSDLATEVKSNPNLGVETNVIPAGDYQVIITKVETNSYYDQCGRKAEEITAFAINNPGVMPGKRVDFTFEVIDGPFKGKKKYESLTLVPAGNQRSFPMSTGGKYGPEEMIKAAKESLAAIALRAGLALAPGTTWTDFENRVLDVHIIVDKKGYNKFRWKVSSRKSEGGEVVSAPTRPKTTAVVTDDEIPF